MSIDPNDVISKKFGMLTIKEYKGCYASDANKKKLHYYNCECDCGKTKTIQRYAFIKLKTKSCECRLFTDPNDVVGKKFNMLTVKKYKGRDTPSGHEQKRHFYECKCECGKTTEVCRNNLINFHTKSCGCLLHTSGEQNKGWKGFKGISGRFWTHIKSGATRGKRDLEFNLDIKYVWDLWESQNGCCALTDLPIELPKGKPVGYRHTASLDRIDSSKGYVKGNVQWVHKDINSINSNFPQNRFIELCSLVTKKMI